ncbi:hypothetical protein E1B28_010288 [Marasmius oreades]|uniref:Homeobox domain-containing protein n=1 Tax=Marasmius oreades TaxID=181124 RepID=A0A9P7RXH5_9AGAR|nr:uncharacterized protein E1B28_010288 [Marasmius oreades]KAG7091237.1 hypothetical protein E1B28_010288 [Marasmius oreades]
MEPYNIQNHVVMESTLPGSQEIAREAPDLSKLSKVKPKRITNEARNLLLDIFYTKNVTNPTRLQREELIQQVQALPKCEHFCMKNLDKWFQYQRQKQKKRKNTDDPAATSSLSAEAIASLKTLHQGTPQPSLEIINLWVDFIHTKYQARPEDVRTWLDNQRRQMDELSLLTPAFSHSPSPTATFHAQLPSPIDTNDLRSWDATQTPDSSHAAPIMSNPYLYSLHLNREPSTTRNTVHFSSEERTFLPTPTPVPEMSQEVDPSHFMSTTPTCVPALKLQPLPDPIRTELLLAIHEGFTSFKSPPRPKTREGLATELAPYQKLMNDFLSQVNDGLFTKWGFQPEGVVGRQR